MIWKDSYRLGVDMIDKQHIELFKMIESLLGTFETDKDWNDKEEYIAAITFMKNYVVKHFKDEEAYQASIQYTDMENHQKEHHTFTNTVLEYEKKFLATNYDLKLVKEFAGMLVSWLIYHVTDTDQKIVRGASAVSSDDMKSYEECFLDGAAQVFQSMFGIKVPNLSESHISAEEVSGDLFSKIEFIGDFKGEAFFTFPKELAFNLMKAMTFMEADAIDEIVCSAMAEISNIISGNVATELQSQNCICDIKPPVVSTGNSFDLIADRKVIDSISIDTGMGLLQISVVTTE